MISGRPADSAIWNSGVGGYEDRDQHAMIFLARRHEPQVDALVAALNAARRDSMRCNRIIDELLSYGRARALVLQPVAIDQWLQGILDEQVLEQHGGEARVESAPERGTTVTLWLPMEPAESA